MAPILPAAGSWPITAPDPDGLVEPALIHYDEVIHDVVESHNYLAGYHLLSHGCDHWPGRNTLPAINPGRMETAAAVFGTMAEIVIVPRYGALGVRCYYRLDSDGGLEIRITCLEDAATTGALAYGAGVTYGFGGFAYAATRGETLTTLRVELRALGTWAAIYDLSPRDRDLTAGTLP